MLADNFRQMGCNDRRRIHYRIAKALCTFPLPFRNPDGRQMEGRFKRWNTGNLFLHIARIHCHIVIKQDFALAHLYAFNLNNILVRI